MGRQTPVIFGRNEQGEFVLTDKSGFGAKTYRGRVTSPKELQDMLIAKVMMKVYAEYMRKWHLWSLLKVVLVKTLEDMYMVIYFMAKHTIKKKKARLYLNQIQQNTLLIQRSAIGRKIAQSKVGVVVHMMIDFDGNVEKVDSTKFVVVN